MKLISYQSEAVLNILKKNQVYKAKPSISFKREYGALIDILSLKCDCPVFAVVKGRKQNTSGRVSGAVRLTLDVPLSEIKFTEFSEWADFMYGVKFSKGDRYDVLSSNALEEIDGKKHKELIESLKLQKPINNYKFPQAILECIKPQWLVTYKHMSKFSDINILEKISNIFRR